MSGWEEELEIDDSDIRAVLEGVACKKPNPSIHSTPISRPILPASQCTAPFLDSRTHLWFSECDGGVPRKRKFQNLSDIFGGLTQTEDGANSFELHKVNPHPSYYQKTKEVLSLNPVLESPQTEVLGIKNIRASNDLDEQTRSLRGLSQNRGKRLADEEDLELDVDINLEQCLLRGGYDSRSTQDQNSRHKDETNSMENVRQGKNPFSQVTERAPDASTSFQVTTLKRPATYQCGNTTPEFGNGTIGSYFLDGSQRQMRRSSQIETARSSIFSEPNSEFQICRPSQIGNIRNDVSEPRNRSSESQEHQINMFSHRAEPSSRHNESRHVGPIEEDEELELSMSKRLVANSQAREDMLRTAIDADQGMSHLPYRIPGPAGCVQKALNMGCPAQLPEPQSDFNGLRDPMYTRNNAADPDFNSRPWITALQSLNIKAYGSVQFFREYCSIQNIKSSSELYRASQLVAIIKTCTPNGCGDAFVTLKDPTGTISGTVYHKVLGETEFGREIRPGAVILLCKVPVFRPTPRTQYLNITVNNVLQVLRKD